MQNRLILPFDLPPDTAREVERLVEAGNDQLAQQIISMWERRQGRPPNSSPPTKTPSKIAINPPPTSGPHEDIRAVNADDSRGLRTRQRIDAPSNEPKPNLKEFEWMDLLAKAEKVLSDHGHIGGLGPTVPLIRLMVAHALRAGARNDPSREAHVFLPLWEVAKSLGVAERTIERWLKDGRWADELRAWLAWEVWYTKEPGISEGAIKGGMMWRVRLRPIYRREGRRIRVLAPYLRLPLRKLAQDAKEGKTKAALERSQEAMSGYKEALKKGINKNLLTFVGKPFLTRDINLNPLIYPDIPAGGLRALLRASSIPNGRGGRVEWAKAVAKAIAQALGDQRSNRMWLKVAYAALKALMFGGGDGSFNLIERAVSIASEAARDGFARNAGAYAQGQLKKLGFWQAVEPFAAYRVGVNGAN